MTNVDNNFNPRIEIKKGIGKIQFGLITDEVEELLGLPDEKETVDSATQSTVIWYYQKLRLQIVFQGPDWASPIPTDEPKRVIQLVTSHPGCTLWGTRIIGRTKDEMIRIFSDEGYVGFVNDESSSDTLHCESLRMESIRVTLSFLDGILQNVLWGKVDE